MKKETAKEPEHRRTSVGKGGRLVIPAPYRKALGMKIGCPVVVSLEGDELRIRTLRRSLARAREIVGKYVPKERSLAAELIKERRMDAAHE